MNDLSRRIEAEIPALRRYALVLTRDSDRADDLVQDCVERALSRWRLWRRPGNLRAWLFTILHNVHANQARAWSRRPGTVPFEEDGIHAAVGADQPTHVEVAETLDALWKLAPEQREALLLVVVEGMTYREVASVLGIPIGTVMSRLARARERLRELVEGPPAPRLRRVK